MQKKGFILKFRLRLLFWITTVVSAFLFGFCFNNSSSVKPLVITVEEGQEIVYSAPKNYPHVFLVPNGIVKVNSMTELSEEALRRGKLRSEFTIEGVAVGNVTVRFANDNYTDGQDVHIRVQQKSNSSVQPSLH